MNFRNITLWVFIALIVFGLFNLFSNTSGERNIIDLTYSQFLDEVEAGSVKDVVIRGSNINGAFDDGRSFKTYAANDPTLVDRLNDRGVNISAAPLDDGYPSLLGVLISWFPMLLLIGVWIFFMRQMQGGRGGAMGFGRSKAKLLTENKNKVTFNDVAGIDEAKEELVEMDGFDTQEGIILVAATNRPDVLDPALLRPGRFDRQVVVPNPDIMGREAILKVHIKKISVAPDVDIRTIARGTPGFSGADLANIVNESALLAARKNKKIVTMVDFEEAKDKVMMGSERRSLVMSQDEKELTAYHEGGHAIVAINQPASDPIHKATIIPRGRALGMVMRLPERDQLSMAREKMLADITVAMGGRVAEEIIFGDDKVTSGASSDIEMATKMARNMVTKYGMSEKLGPLQYSENEEEVFLGRSVQKHQNVSEDTARLIDSEIRIIVDTCYDLARKILTEKINDLHALAKGLIEYETLNGDEILSLLKDGKIDRPNPEEEINNAGPSVPKSGKPSTVVPGFKHKPQTS